jgi:hypothetical protein
MANLKTRLPSSWSAAIVASVVLASGTLLANGESFFIPANKGPVDLVYFARVKNARTGRPIEKPPYVTIVDPYSGIILPFLGDKPGHFRSPDVGAAIKEVSAHPIDTQQLEIVVTASGYHTVKVGNIPRQSKGTIELTVKMEPKTGASGATSSSGTHAVASQAPAPPGTPSPVDSMKPTIYLLAACFGLAFISVAARKAGRPTTTAH